jgi:hypothetical protein
MLDYEEKISIHIKKQKKQFEGQSIYWNQMWHYHKANFFLKTLIKAQRKLMDKL